MVYKEIDYKHLVHHSPSFDFHLHDGCEIYCLRSGTVTYFVEKQLYNAAAGDIIITNQTEIHKPNYEPGKTYERITLRFDPVFYAQFSTPDFDLLACFLERKNGSNNKLHLSGAQQEKLYRIFGDIETLQAQRPRYFDIMTSNLVVELLVLLNEAAQNRDDTPKDLPDGKLLPVINYIDEHLEEDLSLAVLEKRFFISQAYLCRMFKAQTQNTLHQYIIKKRIARAKQLLSAGTSVTRTIELCGFGDFSNFTRSFKKHTGLAPSQFRQQESVKLGEMPPQRQ